MDEAISTANALPFAFQTARFTRRLDVAPKLNQSLDAMTVMINDHTAFRVDWISFASRHESGEDISCIGYTMHDMTQDKLAVIKFWSLRVPITSSRQSYARYF